MNQRLYTIKLGSREYHTTVLEEAALFIYLFEKGGNCKVKSIPYSGEEIPTVINVNQ